MPQRLWHTGIGTCSGTPQLMKAAPPPCPIVRWRPFLAPLFRTAASRSPSSSHPTRRVPPFVAPASAASDDEPEFRPNPSASIHCSAGGRSSSGFGAEGNRLASNASKTPSLPLPLPLPTQPSTSQTAAAISGSSALQRLPPQQPHQQDRVGSITAAAAAAATSSPAGGGGGGGSSSECTRRTLALALAASAAASTLAAAPAVAAAAATAAGPAADGGAGGVGGGGRFAAQSTSPAGALVDGGEAGTGAAAAAARPRRRTWPRVPTVPLARGLRVSKVMRGCWQLSGRHKGDRITDRTSGGEAVSDLAAFHEAGVTSLDLADNYGPAELLVGQYLRLYEHQAPTTTIATKLSYLSEEDMAGASRAMVEYAVRRSLVRLGRQRLDLVQLQWADPVRHRRWLDVLKWLADLREEGLIGHVGVCNFAVPQLAAAVDAGVGLVSNQVQFSLIDRRPQLFMQKAAASYGIKLLAYGTVAGGLLADKYHGVPANQVRLDTASKQKYGLVVRQAGEGLGGGSGGWDWMQEVLEAARTVGQRHGVSTSAVAVAWVLHQPQVAAAIVGARNARHIRDIQAACALQLDEVDMLDLDAVWEGVPQPPTSDVYVWERGGTW